MSIHKMGLVLGLLLAINVFAIALLSMFAGIGGAVITTLSALYIGYSATFVGALLGALGAFIHGYLIGVVYVLLSARVASL